MSAANNRRSVILGIFIFLGLVILLGGVLVAGGKRNVFERTFILYAVFENVGGLQKGNNIWFSGVKVGTVKHLRIVDDGKVKVEMKIEDDSRPFILKDAKIKLGTDGLIGNRILLIYGGTPGKPMVNSDDTLRTEVLTTTAEMMATLQESNRNLSTITTNAKEVSRRLVAGEGTLGSLVSSDQLANQLQATAAKLQTASSNIVAVSNNLAGYTAQLNNKGTLAHELVSDTVIYSRLRASSDQLHGASLNVSAASTNVKSASENMKKASDALNDSNNVTGVLLHDQQSADNMKATISNIRSGTHKFDENMEALQHNFLLRHFFKKREKKEKKEKKHNPSVAETGI
jgi:phospholipid/cholesterol/gamma-HCH transport system substrate-binding protein